MDILSKYRFAAVALISGLLVAVTLSLTYGDNFQAATVSSSSNKAVIERTRTLLETDLKKVEDSLAKYEATLSPTKAKKSSLTLLKSTALKFQKYCRFVMLAKLEFNCGNFATTIITDVNKAVKKKDLEKAKSFVDAAFSELITQFNQ